MNEPAILKQYGNYSALLATFGGVRNGVGMPTFEFMRSMEPVKVDKLYLRDFSQAWYQYGVPPHDSPGALAKYLKGEVSAHEHSVFIGNSMGGFAAILFGVLAGAGKVFAFAPQSFIDADSRQQVGDARWRTEVPALHSENGPDGWYYNLPRLLAATYYETEIHVFYDPEHKLDNAHAESLRMSRNVVLHPGTGGHGIIKQIRDDGRLLEMINESI